MCIFRCMEGNSTTWMNTAVLVTCIRNFRCNRGSIFGILKGYVGLSTAIFTYLCSVLFSDNPAKFLIMLSIIPFVVCLTAVFFLRETPQSVSITAEKEEARYFAIFNVVAVVIAFYLLAYDFIGSTNQVFSLVFVVILLVVLVSPLAVPIYSFYKSWRLVRFEPDVERQEPLLEQEANAMVEATERNEVINDEPLIMVEAVVKKSRPVIGEDHTIFKAIWT